MLEIKSRKYLWRRSEIWFSNTFLHRPDCDYLVLKQCAAEPTPLEYVTASEDFTTLHLNLGQDEGCLWAGLDKTCQRFIRKGERLGLDFAVNNYDHDFLALLNELIGAKKHTEEISQPQYQRYLPHGDVFTVMEDGVLLCGHFYLRDETRCRLFWSASKRLTTGLSKKVGLINRWLHWQAIRHYKEAGLKIYDFGGLNFDESSPAYGITRFKLSFGGKVAQEHNYTVLNSLSLRTAYRLGML